MNRCDEWSGLNAEHTDRAMKHPVELAAAIEEAKRQARRAYETTNDKSLTASPQHRVGGGLFQHALDIADATVILVERGLPCPALALARPLIESWTRGVWASRCAGDQEIDAFLVTGRPGPWRLEKLAQCVKDRIPAESEWLEETMGRPEVMSMLHDLTHGGRWQVQYRCCFALCLVEPPGEFAGLFRRRIAWDDGAIWEAVGVGAVAVLMNRCCRSGEDVGARAPSVGKRWGSASFSRACPHGP